jgi:hypothetical protein
VDYIAPGHCTGEPTFAPLQSMFGDRYLYAGLGTTLAVGAVPRAESARSAALNEDDLRSYRKLLASSDDFKDSAPEAGRLARMPVVAAAPAVLKSGHAAVHGDDLTGDVAGLGGGEIAHQARHLFLASRALHGHERRYRGRVE